MYIFISNWNHLASRILFNPYKFTCKLWKQSSYDFNSFNIKRLGSNNCGVKGATPCIKNPMKYKHIIVFTWRWSWSYYHDYVFNFSILLKQTDEVQRNLFVCLIKHAKYRNTPTVIKYNYIHDKNHVHKLIQNICIVKCMGASTYAHQGNIFNNQFFIYMGHNVLLFGGPVGLQWSDCMTLFVWPDCAHLAFPLSFHPHRQYRPTCQTRKQVKI